MLHHAVPAAVDNPNLQPRGSKLLRAVRAEKRHSLNLVRIALGIEARHGATERVSGEPPMADLRIGSHDRIGGVDVENSQVKRHLRHDAERPALGKLEREGNIGHGIHLGPRVEDHAILRGRVADGYAGILVIDRDKAVVASHLARGDERLGEVARVVEVGGPANKAGTEQRQREHQAHRNATEPTPRPAHLVRPARLSHGRPRAP